MNVKKGKVRPITGHEGPEGEQRYSSALSLTLTPRPGHFTPGKETRYPSCRRLDGSQGRSGRMRKISPPTGMRSPNRPSRSKSLCRLSCVQIWLNSEKYITLRKYLCTFTIILSLPELKKNKETKNTAQNPQNQKTSYNMPKS